MSLTRKIATRWIVTSVQSLSSPIQVDILISVPKRIQNLFTIPNSRWLLSMSPFLLLLALLAGSVFLSDQENLRNCAQLALTSLITQITLQYKQQKRSTTLIVTIVFDITACNNKISNNNKREVWITNRLGGWFLLIFMFFFGFSFLFFVSWVLYYFLFGFLYIFGGPKYFWSHTAQGSTESRNRPTFVIREFSVLTRLKNKTREYGRLPRSEIPFRPCAKGLI